MNEAVAMYVRGRIRMVVAAKTAPITIHRRIRQRLRTRVVPSASRETSSSLTGCDSIDSALRGSMAVPLAVTSRLDFFSKTDLSGTVYELLKTNYSFDLPISVTAR